jgi:hypothetical protein
VSAADGTYVREDGELKIQALPNHHPDTFAILTGTSMFSWKTVCSDLE